jgi:hypothetical protein
MLKIVLQQSFLSKFSSDTFTIKHGWGNGYVLLPINHVYYEVDYNNIPVSVHGGLTYSKMVDIDIVHNFNNLTEEDIGYWMIGFDTSQYGDSIESWPKEAVQREDERLRDQLI